MHLEIRTNPVSDLAVVVRFRRFQIRTGVLTGLLSSVALLLGCANFIEAEGEGGTTGETAPASESSTTSSSSSSSSSTGTSLDPSSPGTTGGGDATVGPASGSSGDGGSDSSGGTSVPECGNGEVEDGEACDDGNQDDDDRCSSRCELSSCQDGRQNGSETATDCGGACLAQCETGEGCLIGDDCVEGVCGDSDVCAEPTCEDGVLNSTEITADCGPVCGTAPANVLLNGDFESGTDDWIVANPELNPQQAYFGDGESNVVVEIDASGDNTSRWEQGFQVPDYQVGETLTLRLRVGDRDNQPDDVGGLLIGISGPGATSLVLTGESGPDFFDNNSTQLGVDATSVASFQTAVVQFVPTAAGGHMLELLEQTSGGSGLNNGSGMVMDDVEVVLVDCENM